MLLGVSRVSDDIIYARQQPAALQWKSIDWKGKPGEPKKFSVSQLCEVLPANLCIFLLQNKQLREAISEVY